MWCILKNWCSMAWWCFIVLKETLLKWLCFCFNNSPIQKKTMFINLVPGIANQRFYEFVSIRKLTIRGYQNQNTSKNIISTPSCWNLRTREVIINDLKIGYALENIFVHLPGSLLLFCRKVTTISLLTKIYMNELIDLDESSWLEKLKYWSKEESVWHIVLGRCFYFGEDYFWFRNS